MEGWIEEPEVLERAEDSPLSASSIFQLEGADDEAHEERQDHDEQERGLPSASAEGDEVRHREAQQQGQHRGDEGVDPGAKELLPVLADDLGVDGEVPRLGEARGQGSLLEARS